jgi:hypothetical protein
MASWGIFPHFLSPYPEKINKFLKRSVSPEADYTDCRTGYRSKRYKLAKYFIGGYIDFVKELKILVL